MGNMTWNDNGQYEKFRSNVKCYSDTCTMYSADNCIVFENFTTSVGDLMVTN